MKNFLDNLRQGKAGETAYALWMRKRGWHLLPVYEIPESARKGPRLYSAAPGENLVAPDLLAVRNGEALWLEVKAKNAASLHRKTKVWTTGIDTYLLESYVKVQERTGWPVWLVFIQQQGVAKGDDLAGPAGVYAQRVNELKERVHHEYGTMSYWGINDLIKVCELEELETINVYKN